MAVPFFRTGYNYDVDAEARENALYCEDPSLTVQSDKDDADINVIVRRFGLTGEMPANLVPMVYGDFTGKTDYQSMLNVVREADERFMAMPAEVRSRFDNDPQRFLEFVEARSDDGKSLKNFDELVKMGLAVAKEPVVVPPVVPPKV